MKSKLLKILRADRNNIHSGENLSSELGISRVSVWKHIHKLQELGYLIRTTPNGYQFEESPDALFSWEFPERETKIHYFQEVDSTMEEAKKLARKGCSDFTIVIAEQQNKGRGRLQRTWISEKGGLYFTLVLRPRIPLALISRVNFAASLNLVKVLRELFDVNAMVKWPNDLLVNERKISGMLSEMEAEIDMVSYLNIGIGLNVNNDPTYLEPKSVSLKELLGREISRKEILSCFLDNLQQELSQDNLDHIISEWKKYTITLNRQVKIVTTREVIQGKAIDVDADGSLILELEDKSIKKIIYGDCFHQ